ncbi:hypothetical protein LC609_09220 [Nostoc sp. XA013]|nr:hypothetical protein [Nostoc sp. XA013]
MHLEKNVSNFLPTIWLGLYQYPPARTALYLFLIKPSIQSTVGHLSPIEETYQGKHPQTPASRRNTHQLFADFVERQII